MQYWYGLMLLAGLRSRASFYGFGTITDEVLRVGRERPEFANRIIIPL